MALIKCEECGKEVSDKAKQCIHCGNPLLEERKNNIETVKKKENETVITRKLPNKVKRTFKDYIFLPIILFVAAFAIAIIFFQGGKAFTHDPTNHFAQGLTFLIVFALPLFVVAVDWTDKEIKWYFRLYILAFSIIGFIFAYSSFKKNSELNKPRGALSIHKDGKTYWSGTDFIKKDGKEYWRRKDFITKDGHVYWRENESIFKYDKNYIQEGKDFIIKDDKEYWRGIHFIIKDGKIEFKKQKKKRY
jgi:predicted permease/ribosomal protein L37E